MPSLVFRSTCTHTYTDIHLDTEQKESRTETVELEATPTAIQTSTARVLTCALNPAALQVVRPSQKGPREPFPRDWVFPTQKMRDEN